MKNLKIALIYLLLGFIFILSSSCEKDDVNADETVINLVDETKQNDFDKYLNAKFVEPYNIQILYKWDYKESDMDHVLVPVNYENSVKMANLILYLCLDAYKAVAPKNFLKKYFPKMIMFVGSPAYNNNGTMVLGTAEGGLKITLYNLNNLKTNDINSLNRYYFRTIYHEFSHILHQTTDYTIEFDKISASDYKSDAWNEAWGWRNPSLVNGFISDYASKEPNEDFVELIAHYITNTEESWEKLMNKADGQWENDGKFEGRKIIERKMEIVKSYLQSVWHIDIDALRKEIQERASKLEEQNLDNIKY